MTKHICLALALALALAGCASVPPKYQGRQVAVCEKPIDSTFGLPYTRVSKTTCAVPLAPFDLAVWHEAPYNSRKVRGQNTAALGCRPLTPEADEGDYSGLPGSSRTLLINFDPSVYPESAAVRRAVLAVYALNNPEGLKEAGLRGRLNVGGELQSLAFRREIRMDRAGQGWVFFEVTAFVARAINERRNSVQFEISRPCRAEAADRAPVTVGLLEREPRLVVEFE